MLGAYYVGHALGLTPIASAKAEHPAIRCLALIRLIQHATHIMAWGADAVAHRDEPASFH